MDDIIEQLRAYERHAEETWTYRQVLSDLLPCLENVAAFGDTEREAQAVNRGLKACVGITRGCSQRDPTMKGVAAGLEGLIDAIDIANNLKAESVKEALETLLLEIDLCMSRE